MERIPYPKKRSEAEIQSFLWQSLREKGIDARLQVTAVNSHNGKRSFKPDMVVFVDKVARCIVEFKSWSDSYARCYWYRTNKGITMVYPLWFAVVWTT